MPPRPLPPGIVVAFYGDDLTGSSSTLEVLAFSGLAGVLFLDEPTPERLARFSDRRAIGIAGIARSRSPAWMDEELPGLFRVLASLGAPVNHYKVCSTFDSSPAIGSIGRAIEIGAPILGGDWHPLLVAAPPIGRYQAFGNLFAVFDGAHHRLDRHPAMSRHPVTPMHEADLRLHLGRQTDLPIGLVDLAAMKRGEGAAALDAERAAGARIVSLDLVDRETSVEAGRLIWERGGERPFAIGSQGVEYALVDYWTAAGLGEERDTRYLRYAVSRLAGFANVWWSLANEYDFLLNVKPVAYWDRLFHAVEACDPHRHLKSIHNGNPAQNFDHRKPWIDHVCIQNWDVKRTVEWRNSWGKPVVNDEPEYEGDIPRPWGNISARELVHRFWLTVVRGGYAGHGETFMQDEDLLWWAKGGELHGESWPRIGFLRALLEKDVRRGLTPYTAADRGEFNRISGAHDGDVRFLYFGEHQPVHWAVGLPEQDGDYDLDLIDTWAMTVTPLEKAPLPVSPALRGANGVVHNKAPEAAFGVRLPGRPYLAVRVRRRG